MATIHVLIARAEAATRAEARAANDLRLALRTPTAAELRDGWFVDEVAAAPVIARLRREAERTSRVAAAARADVVRGVEARR